MAAESGTAKGLKALARNFWRLIADVATATSDKNLSHIAAGVAFYMLLSIFPAIVVGLSLAGFFADVDQNGGSSILEALEPILPDAAYELIAAQITRTVETGGLQLGGAAIVSFLIALWSASAAMRALMTAMHIAFPHAAATSTLWYYVLSLAFTLAAMAFVGVVALVLTALPFVVDAIRSIAEATGVDVNLGVLEYLETPIVMAIMCAVLATVYRLGAARGALAWRAAFKAGLIATVFWILCSSALSYYFTTVGDIGTTYGPLAAFVGLMLWFWLSALILLIGAELASFYSSRGGRADDAPAPPPESGPKGFSVES